MAAIFLAIGIAVPLIAAGGGPLDAHPGATSAAAVCCGISLVLAVAWKAMEPKVVLALHERGVVVHHTRTRSDDFVPFAAMGDLYLYRTGHHGGLVNALAFRRDAASPWAYVLDSVGNAFRLRGAIIEGQLRERGAVTLRALEAGEGVVFHTVSDDERKARRDRRTLPSDVDAKAFVLSSLGVEFADHVIPLADIASVDEGTSSGSLRLLDANGDTLWGVHYLSLFSADLFIVLMRTLIEARHYGLGGVTSNKGY
ncbi:hypothetical protein [Luteibacter yeojuensis]|uniref:Uncharacterized protein n=1 Tax=Luteibacter yeojuensis TaxID=345309 RepID=A0A0F3KG94_9GAMM|nr:hypothetical protein [Luteibacter yeojuensis]KJV29124.1 hypothetical protein VI08_16190 [Luteibacter yeojuensis]